MSVVSAIRIDPHTVNSAHSDSNMHGLCHTPGRPTAGTVVQVTKIYHLAFICVVAATHFYEEGTYRLRSEGDKLLSSDQMVDRLESWVDDYPIASIEDGLAEEDWQGWQQLTDRLGQRIQLVGDDLFATNPVRLQRGVVSAAANSVLIKVNQIGTLTETMETVSMARLAGFSTVVSARSGETEDTSIADLAVAVAADQVKIGSIVRSERLAKYNRLLRISEQIPGWSPDRDQGQKIPDPEGG